MSFSTVSARFVRFNEPKTVESSDSDGRILQAAALMSEHLVSLGAPDAASPIDALVQIVRALGAQKGKPVTGLASRVVSALPEQERAQVLNLL